MNCPNCGREVNENQSYCNVCGSILYGMNQPNLNNPAKVTGSETSNDISSITGIDINSLADVGPATIPDVVPSKNSNIRRHEVTKEKEEKSGGIHFSTAIFIIILAILSGVCAFFGISYQELKNKDMVVCKECEECKEKVIAAGVEGYYGLTGRFGFTVPKDWRYTELVGGSALTNGKYNILIFGLAEGVVTKFDETELVKEYGNQGYGNIKLVSNTLNNKKVLFVEYYANEIYFADFYLQNEDNNMVYGQVSGPTDTLDTNTDIQTILSSIHVLEEQTEISILKAPVEYDEIFNKQKKEEASK